MVICMRKSRIHRGVVTCLQGTGSANITDKLWLYSMTTKFIVHYVIVCGLVVVLLKVRTHWRLLLPMKLTGWCLASAVLIPLKEDTYNWNWKWRWKSHELYSKIIYPQTERWQWWMPWLTEADGHDVCSVRSTVRRVDQALDLVILIVRISLHLQKAPRPSIPWQNACAWPKRAIYSALQ